MGASNSKSNKDARNSSNENNYLEVRLAQVRINTYSGIWEKLFNVEETLEKISKNFKEENNMDTINENYFLQWYYKDSPIEMNNKKLKDFILENNINESSPIEINQKIKQKEGRENMILLDICEIVGKPLYNPFEILTFEPNKKSIGIRKYNNKVISSTKIYKCSIESAYCNGKNHLFISGGVDSSTREILDLFWDIDLKGDDLNSPIQIKKKKNHSMIFTEKKVYIIGGDDLNTLIYDTEKKNYVDFANLNLKRFEPSLIRHNNFLFCFDTTKGKDNKFSIEKIDLNNRENPEWEIIYPNISALGEQNAYSQKFFGLVEDYRQNIIFLGGIYDDSRSQIIGENVINMNMRYNINKNKIEKSDIKFQEISLSEKTFLPIDEKTFFILPNFSKHSPKIIYFNREKNEINISSYVPNNKEIRKKKKENNISIQSKRPWFGLNFDMPGIQNDLNNNDNLNIIESINNNYDLNNRELNHNNEITINNYKFFEKGDLVPNYNYKNRENKNNNENINYQNSINPIIGKNDSYKTNINNNIENSANFDINYNNNINADSKINEQNYPDIKQNFNTNINKDINQNIGKEITTNNGTSLELIHKENNKKNEIKIDIKDYKKEFKSEKNQRKKYLILNENTKAKFHNSVDDPCNYIEKIKVKDLSYPGNISLKLIKLKAREILKSDNNKIIVENY